jgi:hypothetical protein
MHVLPPQICFSKTTSSLLLSPIHLGPPTIPARSCLPVCAAHRASHCSNESWQGGQAARPPALEPSSSLISLLLATDNTQTTGKQSGIQPTLPTTTTTTTHLSTQISAFRKNASPTHPKYWPPACPILRFREESAPGACLL